LKDDPEKMWILTIRSPKSVPQDYVLQPGKNTLGRKSSNDIVIQDELASRIHAEVDYQPERVFLVDLGSTNGTFVNHRRITKPTLIKPGDQIRIGYHLASLSWRPSDSLPVGELHNLSITPITPDLLLESFEKSAILIYEMVNRLATEIDLDHAVQVIIEFLQTAVGAQLCVIILRENFERISAMREIKAIAQKAIQKESAVAFPNLAYTGPIAIDSAVSIQAALCVPVLNDNAVSALICATKSGLDSRPFDQNDFYLAVAVSHQVSLAIKRNQTLKQNYNPL
jgi:hypothetical protein